MKCKCKDLEVVCQTQVKSLMCGEGNLGVLMKCSKCNSLYLKNAFFDTWTTYESQINKNFAIEYKGKLNKTQLEEKLSQMKGFIDYEKLK